MTPTSISSLSSNAPIKRGWIIFEGILYVLVGSIAIVVPMLATIVLIKFIGFLCLFSGIFTLGGLLFNKGKSHHFSGLLTGILFLLAGLILLLFPIKGILVLTLIVAALFISEGLTSLVAGIMRRSTLKGWFWLILNGLVSLALGFLILAKWPIDATAILGLLFGIQLLFAGWSFIMIGSAIPKNSD